MCHIEPYTEEHRQGVIDVVQAVYHEYGFTWEADGYHRDLYEIDGTYIRRGGQFWVLMADRRIVGCVGVSVRGEESELHRMYLLAEYRGRGLGRQLLETATGCAKARGCRCMRAWSDVTLVSAHRLYLRCGFVRRGERICDDPDNSQEYGFWKEPL